MRAATLILMGVSTRVCPRAAVGRSAARWFLEGSLGGLTLRLRSHTLRRCVATDAAVGSAAKGVARGGQGGHGPQPSIEWIFLRKKLILLECRACFIQYSSFADDG